MTPLAKGQEFNINSSFLCKNYFHRASSVRHIYLFSWTSLLIENNIGLSPLTTLITLILASLGFVLRGAIDLKNPFSKDFSMPIIIAAVATLLLFILEYLAYRSISQSIELKQLEGFHIVRIDNFWLCFTSLGLFWLASVMKKGYHLQNEQNLTI